ICQRLRHAAGGGGSGLVLVPERQPDCDPGFPASRPGLDGWWLAAGESRLSARTEGTAYRPGRHARCHAPLHGDRAWSGDPRRSQESIPDLDDGGRGHSAALLYEPGRPVSLSLRIPTARGERRPPRGPVPLERVRPHQRLRRSTLARGGIPRRLAPGTPLGRRLGDCGVLALWRRSALAIAVAAADLPGRGQRPRRALGIGRFVRRQPAPGDAWAVDRRRGAADADSLRLPEWNPRAFRPRDAGRAGLTL